MILGKLYAGVAISVIFLLIVALAFQTYRVMALSTDLEEARHDLTRAVSAANKRALEASELHRRREAVLTETIEVIRNESLAREEVATAAAAAYRTADERLRQRLTAAVADRDRARKAAAAAGQRQAAVETIDMPAVLLRWSEEDARDAGEVAGFAERSDAAVADCSARYSAAQTMTQSRE